MAFMCPGTTVQIGYEYFMWNDKITRNLQRGPSGKTASISLQVFPGSPAPSAPNIVSIVSATGRKKFGGMIEVAPYEYDGAIKVYGLSCIDFSEVVCRAETIDNYVDANLNPVRANFAGHLFNWFTLSGADQYANFAIIGPPDPSLDTEELFTFPVEGYLYDILNQYGEKFGYYWEVDFGGWLDTNFINPFTAKLCTLRFIKNGYSIGPAPFDIILPNDISQYCPPGGNIVDKLKIMATPPRISRVTALGVNGVKNPLLALVGYQRETETKLDIPANSVRREYPIKEEAGEVSRVHIDSV